MPEAPDEKQMQLRYAGTCRLCGTELAARVEAVYERRTKTVRCITCSPAARAEEADHGAMPTGTAGGSARREYERRRARREERVRQKHPKIGGFLLAVTADPQTTTAWDTGARGEERLGRRLDELTSETVRVLHDRRIPGTRANIDHLAVTPTGVYVIDAKRYVGKRPSLKVEGGLLRPRTEKLMVDTRDQTQLVDVVLKQVNLVRSVVGEDLLVIGVLCFIEADWPLIGGAFTTRGVEVLWPKKLYPRLVQGNPIAPVVPEVHRRLASAFPPA